MKNKILPVLLAVVIIVGAFTLTGCENSENSLVGSWGYSGFVYTFNADGTGTYDASGTLMPFTYEDDGDKITITYEGNTIGSTYEYKIEGNKFIIKDSFGSDVEYTRK